MINEANASSSACRLWRIPQVETGAPPSNRQEYNPSIRRVGQVNEIAEISRAFFEDIRIARLRDGELV